MKEKIKKIREILKGESFNLIIVESDGIYQVGQKMNLSKLMIVQHCINTVITEKIATGTISSTKEKVAKKKVVSKKTK